MSIVRSIAAPRQRKSRIRWLYSHNNKPRKETCIRKHTHTAKRAMHKKKRKENEIIQNDKIRLYEMPLLTGQFAYLAGSMNVWVWPPRHAASTRLAALLYATREVSFEVVLFTVVVVGVVWDGWWNKADVRKKIQLPSTLFNTHSTGLNRVVQNEVISFSPPSWTINTLRTLFHLHLQALLQRMNLIHNTSAFIHSQRPFRALTHQHSYNL